MRVIEVGRMKSTNIILIGRPEWKRPLGRQAQMKDNIKVCLKEIGFEFNMFHIRALYHTKTRIIN
jgi:hypothetical protein